MHEPLGLGAGGVERDPPDDVDRDLHPGGLLPDDLHVLRRVPGRGARTLDSVCVVGHRQEDVVGVGEPAPGEPGPEPRIGPNQPVGRGHDRAERVAGAGGAPDRGGHPEQAGGPQARPADLRRLDVERERIEPVPVTGLEPDRPNGPMQVEPEIAEPRQVPRDHLDPPTVRGVEDRLHAVQVHDRPVTVVIRALQVDRADAVRGHRPHRVHRVLPDLGVVDVDPGPEPLVRPRRRSHGSGAAEGGGALR